MLPLFIFTVDKTTNIIYHYIRLKGLCTTYRIHVHIFSIYNISITITAGDNVVVVPVEYGTEHYEIDPAVAAADVRRFLAGLREAKLLA